MVYNSARKLAGRLVKSHTHEPRVDDAALSPSETCRSTTCRRCAYYVVSNHKQPRAFTLEPLLHEWWLQSLSTLPSPAYR